MELFILTSTGYTVRSTLDRKKKGKERGKKLGDDRIGWTAHVFIAKNPPKNSHAPPAFYTHKTLLYIYFLFPIWWRANKREPKEGLFFWGIKTWFLWRLLEQQHNRLPRNGDKVLWCRRTYHVLLGYVSIALRLRKKSHFFSLA